MKTILLADDSITIQKVVELTFSDGDYRVFCVANGAQALRKIPEIRPDVVLLDVVMPEKNGYEVCEALRSDPATASIPVLLLTGTFEPFDRARAEAAGARGHVTKPFESHTLVQRVEELLSQAATRGPSPAAPAAFAPPAAAPSMQASSGGPSASAVGMSTSAPEPAPVFPPAARSASQATGPHPAFPPAEPDPGGAYLGFADLAIGEEETVVRDRYDEMDAPVTPEGAATAQAADQTMEGFVSGYEMPAESSQDEERPGADFPPRRSQGATPIALSNPASEAPRAGGAGADLALSADTLDRLADLVIRRMSERVVREIAWEVIPGVAESIVRQRIKELEERES
ncbi:MAG TPA: response regulator [Patescibacteria group bacterium]|nr:response regulator [Patescibacteria group bacterium]